MKTLLIGLSILGLTNLMNSQSLSDQVVEVKLSEVVVTPTRNVSYTNAVYDHNLPKQVQQLESEAGNYDITTSNVYTNSFETYEVLFKTTDGSIIASYDENGKLLNSVEKYDGIMLPTSVINTLKDHYSDWKLNSTAYCVNYFQNKDVKKVYQVQLKKDNKKMNLKIDSDGVILNPKHK